MKYNTPHKTYVVLLLFSLILTGCTFLLRDNSWNTIVASVGAGGVASVCVAWLLDIRNTKIKAIENKRKTEEIMNQFVRIYRRMFWAAANECYGFSEKEECHSFQDWLSFLCLVSPSCPSEGQASIKKRCTRISGCIVSLQRQIEIFQSQSATLIFEEFPKIEQALPFFEMLWTHCWGTLKQLEAENYTAFCDTTYILYTDFINAFPQYQDRFPTEYSAYSFKP